MSSPLRQKWNTGKTYKKQQNILEYEPEKPLGRQMVPLILYKTGLP